MDAELTTREHILDSLKKRLIKAQQNMKYYADQHRTNHSFKPGDLVLVKLRPYRRVSIASQCPQKLSKRYYGPYKLLRSIGDMAFELQLPPSSKIHPIFHVSQLRPCHDSFFKPLDLPPDTIDNSPQIQPLAILAWKDDSSSPDSKVLIQWAGLYLEDATWNPSRISFVLT